MWRTLLTAFHSCARAALFSLTQSRVVLCVAQVPANLAKHNRTHHLRTMLAATSSPHQHAWWCVTPPSSEDGAHLGHVDHGRDAALRALLISYSGRSQADALQPISAAHPATLGAWIDEHILSRQQYLARNASVVLRGCDAVRTRQRTQGRMLQNSNACDRALGKKRRMCKHASARAISHSHSSSSPPQLAASSACLVLERLCVYHCRARPRACRWCARATME
jgi:hypothetical protein